MQFVGILLAIAVIGLFVTSSLWLLCCIAICMIAGAGVYAFLERERQYKREEKQRLQREWDLEADFQRRKEEREEKRQELLLLIEFARRTGARVDVPTLEISKQKIKRIGKH